MRGTRLKLKKYSFRNNIKIFGIASNIAAKNGYTLSELIRAIMRHIANDKHIIDRLDFGFDINESFTTTVYLEKNIVEIIEYDYCNTYKLIQAIIYNIATYNKVFDNLTLLSY